MQLYMNRYYTQNDSIKGLEKAINLLDNAIKIDSNYSLAYWNKLTIQETLKQYKNEIETGKQLIKIRPDNNVIISIVGRLYEKLGDTGTSVEYYQKALLADNSALEKMSGGNETYKSVITEKAFDLILLNKQVEDDIIFKELAREESNPEFKQRYLDFAKWSRADVIDGSI